MPRRIAARPRTKEGYPVPFVNFVHKDGTPDLRILDQRNVATCVKFRLCAICGAAMDQEIVFVGGVVCESNLFFADPAMHEECARYAMKVCPFLAIQGYHHSRATMLRKPATGGAVLISENPLAPPAGSKRPERMVMVFTNGYSLARVGGQQLIRSNRPIRTEYF